MAMLTRLRSKKEVLRNDLATWTSQQINLFTQKPRNENRSPFDVPSNIIYIELVLQGLGSQCSVLRCSELELFFCGRLEPTNSKIGRTRVTRSFLLVPQTKRKDRTAKVIEVHEHPTTVVQFDFLTWLGVSLVGFLTWNSESRTLVLVEPFIPNF